ncbi:MAG: type II toxin-antitoxin system toxin endoribonuclease MazF3 [Mycobacteriales bacterium]
MRPLHWASLDKRRPVLVLTRELMVGRMSTVTVAPITRTLHGIATELEVGPANGLDQTCAITCDQITSIPIDRLHEQCGWLLESQELALHDAIQAHFDLV